MNYTMAAVYPRTCYKCGEVGHVADDCQQEERLCYNCHKPGHESNDCPDPKQKYRQTMLLMW